MAKILIIDDSAFARMRLKASLTRGGYEIIEAATGEGGLDKYKQEKPDIVLLDIILEKTPGDVILQEILKVDPKAKVVMVTAVGQKDEMKDCLKKGACDYIVKPIEEGQILEVVEKVLGGGVNTNRIGK